jgi:hypothetical protein
MCSIFNVHFLKNNYEVFVMHRMVYLDSKKYKLNLIKLIGSFILFIGIVGIFVGMSDLYLKHTAINYMDDCYNPEFCTNYFYETTGISLAQGQVEPLPSQVMIIMFTPIMHIMWWIVVMLIGILIANLGMFAPYLLSNRITHGDMGRQTKKKPKPKKPKRK